MENLWSLVSKVFRKHRLEPEYPMDIHQYPMDEPCARCGCTWNEHIGELCPDCKGNFVSKREQIMKEIDNNERSNNG